MALLTSYLAHYPCNFVMAVYIPARQKVLRYVHSFRDNTDIVRKDGRTEMVKQCAFCNVHAKCIAFGTADAVTPDSHYLFFLLTFGGLARFRYKVSRKRKQN